MGEEIEDTEYWCQEHDDELDSLLSLISYEDDYQWDFIFEHMRYQTMIETIFKKHCE